MKPYTTEELKRLSIPGNCAVEKSRLLVTTLKLEYEQGAHFVVSEELDRAEAEVVRLRVLLSRVCNGIINHHDAAKMIRYMDTENKK